MRRRIEMNSQKPSNRRNGQKKYRPFYIEDDNPDFNDMHYLLNDSGNREFEADAAMTGSNGEYFNGFGRFTQDGKEYEIILTGETRPPAPWINVISSKKFGFTISESGAGVTWSINSRENKITPWSNDPVSDSSSEAIYIRDESTEKIITPTSLGRRDNGDYIVRHGFGYTKFFHREDEIQQKLIVTTPEDDAVKLWHLTLKNTSDYEKHLSLYYYVEWVFGFNRELTNPYIITAYESEDEFLFAKSIYNYYFRNHYGFIFSSENIEEYTGDRREFLGRKGSVQNPAGIFKPLSNNTGEAYDTCGVIKISISLKPGESREMVFGLGQSADFEEISKIVRKYKDVSKIHHEMERTRKYWNDILGKIQVRTSDRAMDILVNGWLLYQTISCRINARAAFYQCGGAYGFRDQLQDVLAVLDADSKMVKQQILISCSRQFEEGDVQHWWHPPTGSGVRTRITDDLLWLPYVTYAYIIGTGDYSVLKEKVAYLQGQQLRDNQHEIMFTPVPSILKESVYEHCKKTILNIEYGKHGLPKIGGGDWNDGMNTVGIEGKGESVWLGWFVYEVLNRFVTIAHFMEDKDFAGEMEKARESLRESIERHAWDGEWYLRAFYDSYEKMGSRESDECKIDSISQSWAVISGGAEKKRALRAIKSAQKYLVKEKDGISLLLTPAFDNTHQNPGYIKNYYPGIRENGGQYTHAAIWLAMAAAVAGEKEVSKKLFAMLNPIHKTSTAEGAQKYEKEPYVMVADIYYTPALTGRGGWSWYTGSAGWMYQGIVNTFLGIRKEHAYLVIKPLTPASFGNYTVWYKHESSTYEIRVQLSGADNAKIDRLTVDGNVVHDNRVELVDDGKFHTIICLH
jgi:cellobiose phosphorylase